MEIIVPQSEPGERDLSIGEIGRKRDALLGRRGSTYKRSRAPQCVVAVFTDDEWDRAAPERAELILGVGDSFAEAFAAAKRSISNGRAAGVDLAVEIPERERAR